MEFYVYTSSDFQCPATGVPVCLVYNKETGFITAEICSMVWYEESEFWDEELDKETEDWCNRFREYAEDIDKANEIAEKYDCWF